MKAQMHPHGYSHHEGNPFNPIPPHSFPIYQHPIHAYNSPIYHYLPLNPYPYHYFPYPTSYPFHTHPSPPCQTQFPLQRSACHFPATDPCDYTSLAKDEIETLKERIEEFTRMAKEDTANLRAEIRSELKHYLTTLRKEGLPLEEIETKMLAMMEEFMRTSSSRIGYPLEENLPTLEANPRKDAQTVEKKVGSEGLVDCYALVLEEVPIFELESPKEAEMESEDEEVEVVWEDREPTYGNTSNSLCNNALEIPCAFDKFTFDTCSDDSLSKYKNDLYSHNTECFYFREDESISFIGNLINECEGFNRNIYTPCKDNSPRIDISTNCDYECFNFWEDESTVNCNISIGVYRDPSLCGEEYDSFSFVEEELDKLGRDELISKGEISPFHSCTEYDDSLNHIDWEDKEGEYDQETMEKEGIFLFDLLEEIEESDMIASGRIWLQSYDRIDKDIEGGKKYDKTTEEDTTLGESLGVLKTKHFTTTYHTLLLFGFEFKDVLHLGAFLEAKVHGTLGKVPKSVCLAG